MFGRPASISRERFIWEESTNRLRMERFRPNPPVIRKGIIITVLVLVALLAAWCLFAPRIIWDGIVIGRFAVNVVDERTNAPIVHATVELRRPCPDEAPPGFSPEHYDKLIASATTAVSGGAQIASAFGAGGSGGFFGRSGRVNYRHIWLQVSAEGYETVRMPLSQFTGDTGSLGQSQTHEFTIKLAASRITP